MTIAETITMFQSAFASTTGVIEGVLPTILGFLGVLIGLAVAIRYVKRWIGSR